MSVLIRRNDSPQFLIGVEDAKRTFILVLAEVSDQPEERLGSINKFLPGGFSVRGIAVGANTSTDRYVDLLKSNNCDQPLVIQKGSGPERIDAVTMATGDGLTTVKWEVEDVPLLSLFTLARTTCSIPIAFCVNDTNTWQTMLNAELDRVIHDVTSASTLFHLINSSILIGSQSCYGLPEGATVQSLTDMTSIDDTGSRKKKDKKQHVLSFDVYTDTSSDSCLERLPSCAPVINYKTGSKEVVSVMLQLDTVSVLPPALPSALVSSTLATALHRQLIAYKQCITQNSNSKTKKFVAPSAVHCQPVISDALFSVVYPCATPDDQLGEVREKLHGYFCLPTDRPLFRQSNQITVLDGAASLGGYLVNVHESVGKSKVSGGCVACVQGSYTYHHYMQDRFDDNKWGCAYRSLQTLVSWFRLQGYTDVDIPSHPKIQQTLVDIGDKEAKFVGSRQWIGSMEVSFVLDTLLGVTSKIMSVGAGSELSGKGRELVAHFQTEGTPIMIGGGVLAHTILGVDYNEVSGEINFLILDPHYTGAEDIKTIKDKGWCGWKGPDFWDQNARYNLCMPQRPRVF